jgi:Holliday junction resolvasome RuvABC endonuclease subunit
MITLSFDQSLANSGWSVLSFSNIDDFTLVNYGTIRTKSNLDFIDRLIIIEQELSNLIYRYSPNIVFLEQVHCPRNSPFAWPQLLVVEAIYKLWLTKNNIQYSSISPKKNIKTSWRYLLNIKTNDKTETKQLFKNLKINEHIADSLAINLAGIYQQHFDELLGIDIVTLVNKVNQ